MAADSADKSKRTGRKFGRSYGLYWNFFCPIILLDLLRLSTASWSHERINIHHVSSFSKETMETSLAIC
jgi:hypothetical protein